MCDMPGIPESRSIPANADYIQCTELEQGRRWICHCPGRHVWVTDSAPTNTGELNPSEDFEDTELGGVLVECSDDDPFDTFTIIDPPTAPADGIRYMLCYDV